MQFRTQFLSAVTVATAVLGAGVGRSEETEAQRATEADLVRLFEPRIGVFRSPDFLYDDGKTEHHFRISYEWFDREKRIIKFQVSTVIPSQSRTLVNSEGFYWRDPVQHRIAVFGAFKVGQVGSGAIVEFDHDAGTHTLRATNVGTDGQVTEVRDAFERIDANSWRNKTAIRSGSEDWKVVHEGVYTRVQDEVGAQ